jgi:serine/threonine protein phosphatase 1
MTKFNVSQFPGEIPSANETGSAKIARFRKNLVGRDFIVGDVHGMFEHLEVLLGRIDFDPRLDRLFSVGDLVDRGPHSEMCLNWLGQSWFCACQGNHEQFALAADGSEQFELWVNYNGGGWWLNIDESNRVAYRKAFASMPLAIELETNSGTLGIVHADVHPQCSWEQFTKLLESGDDDVLFYALWSRMRVSGEFTEPVSGEIDRVYCGHTPTKETVLVGNVWFIDTGAVYSHDGYQDARLTIVEVHPERHVEHSLLTTEDLEPHKGL